MEPNTLQPARSHMIPQFPIKNLTEGTFGCAPVTLTVLSRDEDLGFRV